MATSKTDMPRRALSNVHHLRGNSGDDSLTLMLIEDIVPWDGQPRRSRDPQKFAALVESVSKHGVIQPLTVRLIGDDKHQIVAGERRWRAAKEAGLRQVPVVIRELDDRQAYEFALIENLQREDLNPIDETEGILDLLVHSLNTDSRGVVSILNRMANEAKKKSTRSATGNLVEQEPTVLALFKQLGISWQTYLKNKVPMLAWPEDLLNAVRKGQLDDSKAKLIVAVKNQETRAQLIEDAIETSLSYREIQREVQKLNNPKATQKESFKEVAKSVSRNLAKAERWEDTGRIEKLHYLLGQLQALFA
jgi:ParB family transcriptional regulator, chromosome partitioning protein